MVRIWFDEPVQTVFESLTVTTEDGTRVDKGDVHVDAADPKLLECGLKPGLKDGTYAVHWRVISADGHPVEGIISFRIGAANADVGVTEPFATSYFPRWDTLTIRWLQYLSLATFLGGLLFWRFALTKDLRVRLWQGWLPPLIWWAWAGLLVSSLLNLPLETSLFARVSWAEALLPDEWTKVLLYTSFGPPWIAGLLVLLVLMMLIRFVFASTGRSAVGAWVLVVAGAVLSVLRSMSGHAADGSPRSLSVALDALHLVAASVWVGGIVGLVWLGVRWKKLGLSEENHFGGTVRRFGWLAAASVMVLALTGLYAGFQNIPTLYALMHTTYGKALLVKLGLVLVMLVLGGIQYFAARRFGGGDAVASRVARRVELTVGALILLVTAVLTNLPTARADPGPVNLTKRLSGQGMVATLHITPNTVGMNQFEVVLLDDHGKPVTDVQQVTLTLDMTQMEMGVDEIRLRPTRPGVYQAQGMYLTMAGPWIAHVHVLKQDLTTADGDFDIYVGSPQAQ
jgi:copper transport protein